MEAKHLTALRTLEAERVKRACHEFIFGRDYQGRAWLVTKDEHDPTQAVKPFPDTPYLRAIVDCLLVSGRYQRAAAAIYAREIADLAWLEASYQSGLVAMEKSRQMMVTWIVCAYLLWRAKYHAHQLILVQSKREDDAANLVFNKEPSVARISFMEAHLPKYLRHCEWPKAGAYGHLYFPSGSHIWAIPEGGEIIRSNTASAVFSDECAFQPEFGSAYTAALPAIKGGGQGIFVSSPHPGEFMQVLEVV